MARQLADGRIIASPQVRGPGRLKRSGQTAITRLKLAATTPVPQTRSRRSSRGVKFLPLAVSVVKFAHPV